jgi:7-carboxy-7-deazaguanine synthase
MIGKHLINSIYRATEGEGIFLGRPQVFVRYQGCSVGCLNCDSKDTWEFDQSMGIDLTDIIDRVHTEGFNGKIKNISITGGDPLHPSHVPHVLALVTELKARGYYINIEAAGTRVVPEIFDLVDWVSFDFKTPSTGVRTPIKNLARMLVQYPQKTQFKAVIADSTDFSATQEARAELEKTQSMTIPFVLTPCYNTNESFPMERFQNVLDWNEESGGHFRVIGQQHKWVFGPNEKLV